MKLRFGIPFTLAVGGASIGHTLAGGSLAATAASTLWGAATLAGEYPGNTPREQSEPALIVTLNGNDARFGFTDNKWVGRSFARFNKTSVLELVPDLHAAYTRTHSQKVFQEISQ